jgi:lysophospholipase L1-like esterase
MTTMTLRVAMAGLAALCGLSLALSAFVLTNGDMRRALRVALGQKIAFVYPPRVIVVGDSLGERCSWSGLSKRPFGVYNLALGGATIKEIAGQIPRSYLHPAAAYLLIDGGLNDVLFDDSPLAQIENDYRALMRRVDQGKTPVVTLMPYVSDPNMTARIDAGNAVIRRLCAERPGCVALDLNPLVSADGVRRPEMTDDGIHFSDRANAVWVEAVRRAIAQAGG